MPRVLVITYAYPPAGNVGVHRVLRFLKWLPRLGWQPVVLTPRNAAAVNAQASLADAVRGIPVHRTYSFEALNASGNRSAGPGAGRWDRARRGLMKLPSSVWQSLAVPDGKLGWVPFAIAAGHRLLGREPVDAIYVTGKPFSSFLIAQRLARRAGVPWVMDLRDLWALNKRDPEVNWWHRVADARLERWLVGDAAAVIANTPGNRRELLEAYPDCDPETVVTITNGYDREQFDGPPVPRFDRFTIAYTGTFYYGKPSKPEDEIFDTHSPIFLFRALRDLFDADPEMRRHSRVVIAGPRCELARQLAVEHGLADVVQLDGWVSHEKSLDLLKRAHLLLLVLARGEHSRSWIPAKLYQYLGSGTAILGLLPDGDAATIVRETGSGTVVPPDDVSRIRVAVRDAYDRYRRGVAGASSEWDVVRRYEAEALARQLVDVLCRVSGRDPSDAVQPVGAVSVAEPHGSQ